VQPGPLATSLVAGGSDVPARVDRLLAGTPYSKNSDAWITSALASAGILFAGCLIAPMFVSGTLRFVHICMERLIH
jgi:hypothetical protein